MMDANLINIRKKLASGEKLSINDLRSLEPLHDAIYNNDGRVIGVSDSTATEENGLLSGEFNIDYVDRAHIDGRHHQQHGQSSERLPSLVRYVGMVQDMLDPEYYESYDSRGRSRHFGDHYEPNNDDDNSNGKDDDRLIDSTDRIRNDSDTYHVGRVSECLAERIPLVVVPIPYASDWLYRGVRDPVGLDSSASRPKASKSAVVSPVSNIRGERKRVRNDVYADGDSIMNGGHNPSSFVNGSSNSNQQTKQKTTSNGDGKSSKDDGGGNGKEYPLTSNSTNATDWWPVGTCGTSMDECPVLAKICYEELTSGEQDYNSSRIEEITEEEQIEVEMDDSFAKKGSRTKNSQRPLMLNDVVSLVGVLSMNPWDADFSEQQSSSLSSREGADRFGWDSIMAATNAIPPPSRMPRLHVLSYRRFDLDDLARRAINVEKRIYCKRKSNDGDFVPEREGVCDAILSYDVDSDNDSDNDDDSRVEWSGFPMQEKSTSSGIASLLQDIPSGRFRSSEAAPWIRALWSCLLSQADRRQTNEDSNRRNDGAAPKIVRAGPAERALGSVSLQLSTTDVASAKSLYQNLAENILPGICPVVATLDLIATTTTGTSDTSLIPRKDNSGRLKPCPLQLPKGSVLLVHYPPPCVSIINSGSQNSRLKNRSENDDNNKLQSIQNVLRELVQHHRIPYRFEGGVMIPFEADYRVIIVTTQTQDLPCTLSALTKTCSNTATTTAVLSPTRACPSKPELREILIKSRSLNYINDSLKFSSILLERAQRDFLERRRRYHESSSLSTIPGEDDFHRWLTLTKLQFKDRFSRDERSNNTNNNLLVEGEAGRGIDHSLSLQYSGPSVKDWEAALQLDDDIRCMI